MQTLSPMGIKIPSPYTPDSTELFDWENFLRDAFTRVNNMAVLGTTNIINAKQYSTINEAIAAGLALNSSGVIVWLPVGTYTWTAETYSAASPRTIILKGDGATVNVTGRIDFGNNVSVYLEGIDFRNQHSGKVIGVTGKTGRTDTIFVRRCSFEDTTTQTDYLMHLKFDIVVFDDVKIKINNTFSSRIVQAEGNTIYWYRVSLTSPAEKNPYGFYMYAQNAFFDKCVFSRTQNYTYPLSDATTAPNYYFQHCSFELNYGDTSSTATAVFLNITSTMSCNAFFNMCSFVNKTTEKQNVGWGITADSPINCVVQNCYFENMTGIRGTGNIYYTDKVPSITIVGNTFRNCYRRAIEILFAGYVTIKDNLFYTDGDWTHSSYTTDGYGEAIRLVDFPIPAGYTSVNPYVYNGVVWLVEDNVIRRYLKAGIRVHMAGSSAYFPNRVVGKTFILKNNECYWVSYGVLPSAERTNYLNIYTSDTQWEIGSAVAITSAGNYNVSNWVAFDLDGLKAIDCYHGFAQVNTVVSGDGWRGQVFVRRLHWRKSTDVADTPIKRPVLLIGISSSAKLQSLVFEQCRWYGDNNWKPYCNAHLEPVYFENCVFVRVDSTTWSDWNSSVRRIYLNCAAYVTGTNPLTYFESNVGNYEGNIEVVDTGNTKLGAGGVAHGILVGYLSRHAERILKEDGSAPVNKTRNGLTLPAYPITSTNGIVVPLRGNYRMYQQPRKIIRVRLDIYWEDLPNGSYTVSPAIGSSPFPSSWTTVSGANFTVSGGGAGTWGTTTLDFEITNPSTWHHDMMMRFRLSSDPSSGAIYVVHASVTFLDRVDG